MSRYFDELERRLRDAAAERYAPPATEAVPARAPRARRGAGWARRHRRLLVAAVAALAGLAVPALGAVTDLWRPDVRPAPPMRTMTAAPSSSVACAHEPRRRLDVGSRVGSTFTSVLGVLARPRTAADTIERRYLRNPELVDVDVHGIRYLGAAPDGMRYFVIPAGGLGQPPWPERCLRNLNPRTRRLLEHQPRREPTICVIGGGSAGCGPLADVRRHGSYGATGTMNGRATVAGVVPNGVRAVRVTYGRSTRTFPVRDNFFAFRVALDTPQAASPDRVEWQLADGSYRDITRPSPTPRPNPAP